MNGDYNQQRKDKKNFFEAKRKTFETLTKFVPHCTNATTLIELRLKKIGNKK